MTERVPAGRCLDQTGQQRGVRQRDFSQVLAEINVGRLSESANAEAALMPDVDRVRVIFENLLLRELLFQMERDQSLGDLAPYSTLGSQPQRTRELLGQRG